MKLKIVEIAPTIEGEGLWIGLPVVILRLFGCNLRCSWCDSERSYINDELATLMSIEEILTEISKSGFKRVAITGGEPFLTNELPYLVSNLIKNGYIIKIETNGTLWNEGFELNKNINIVCSPKPDGYFINKKLLQNANELKFVIDENINLEILLRSDFKDRYNDIPLILQPESNRVDMLEKAIHLQKELLSQNIESRVIPQVHKFLGIP